MVRTTNVNLHLTRQIQNVSACSDQLNLLEHVIIGSYKKKHVIIGSTSVKQTYHGTNNCY